MLAPLVLALALQLPESEDWTPHVEPASEDGARAIEGFELAEGFECELWAAEPQLANPVALYVDHSGDVYVAETFRHFAGVTDMREHMDWLDDDAASRTVGDRVDMIRRHEGERFAAYGIASDRLKWLRDADGNGRADVDVVFADGFTKPEAGIGAGVLSYKGDVYYTCIPDLWKLRDEDGNMRAEVRQALSTGYGVNIALLGHDLHGLRIGPDGKLYFSCGDRGFHVETERGPIAHAHAGAVLRCDLDGSNLEVFATGLRNPQELVFDEYGNLFTGDNNSDGGDKARWVHVIEGGDSGWRYGYQFLTEPNLRGPWNDEKLWHPRHAGQAAYIVPPVANLGAGPSGLTYDPGTGLPERYRNHFFLCDFRGDPSYSGIHAFTVRPAGASFELGPVHWFVKNVLVTDCDFGPDGSLYMSDWVNSWDITGKGRIYRMFAPDALAAETARLLKEGMGERSVDELVDFLAHADQRVRQEAQFELVRRREFSVLSDIYEDESALRLKRLHALWGLGMLGGSPAVSWSEKDEVILGQLARVLGDAPRPRENDDWILGTLSSLLERDQPSVRMQAAIALGKRRDPSEVKSLFDMLERDGEDPVMRHATVMGLIGCASPEQIAMGASFRPEHVRLGAVVALRRLKDRRVEIFLNDESELVRLEAARAIYDVPIPEEIRSLAFHIHSGEPLGYALGRRVLHATLHTGHPYDLAYFALDGDQDERLRLEALELLGLWRDPPGRDRVTGEWRPVVGERGDACEAVETALAVWEVFPDASPAVLSAWLRLFADLRIEAAADLVVELALDAQQPAQVRLEALRAAGRLDAPGLGEAVRGTLFDREPEVRAAALDLLSEIDTAEALPLLQVAATEGQRAERRAAYRILGKLDAPKAEDVLAAELERLVAGALPGEVALELRAAAEARDSARLDELLARCARIPDEALAPFTDSLLGGDANRGRKLFVERADLSCLRCHLMPEAGPDAEGAGRAAIGPDLRGVGARSTRLQMLESIVDPNRRITTGYQGTLFFLRDETRIEGQVLTDEPDLVRVLDAEGVVHEIDPAEVETRRAGLSAMPEGMAALVTREEMRDLIEFLSSL